MPSIVTHHLFAKDLYKHIKREISYPHLLIFTQSFDNFFYYQFLTPWTGSEIRGLGTIGQQQNVQKYFEHIIDFIDKNNYQNNSEVIAYLYGSIAHYILDSICHPFVFYYTKTPTIDKNYRGYHEKMEVNLDAYMLKMKEQKDLSKINLANELLPKIKFSKELIHTMNYSFHQTFSMKNIGEKYYSSVQTGNFLLKYFVTDKLGIKKQLYKMKDYLCFWSGRRYEYLSFHVTEIIPEYLNLEHHTWCNPSDETITSTKSFEELYQEALEKTITLIHTVEDYWQHKITKKELLQQIGNNSYSTGLSCDLKLTMKHFKDS